MIIGHTEQFYQELMRLGLFLPDLDGWQYRYDIRKRVVLYERRVNTWHVVISVNWQTIEALQDRVEEFETAMNEMFSESYAAHISKNLTKG